MSTHDFHGKKNNHSFKARSNLKQLQTLETFLLGIESRIQGPPWPGLGGWTHFMAPLRPLWGTARAPTQSANCPSSSKMHGDTMVPAWAPWHCPRHHLCMADRRRGGETDNLWFGVTQPHLLGEGGRGQNQSGEKPAPFLYLVIWLGSSQDKQKLWRAFQFNKILKLVACF